MNDIIKQIIIRMDDAAKSLVENPAPDYPSYRERLGVYAGLKEALEIISNAENDDNRNSF